MKTFLHIELEPTLSAIDQAREDVRSFCRAQDLRRHTEIAVMLVIEELITNSLEHGQCPNDASISVDLDYQPGTLVLEYRDSGVEFDPTPLLGAEIDIDATMSGTRLGGFGWQLIGHYCHECDYRREGQQNVLRLAMQTFNQ